jgi:hypothetical protein
VCCYDAEVVGSESVRRPKLAALRSRPDAIGDAEKRPLADVEQAQPNRCKEFQRPEDHDHVVAKPGDPFR